MTTTVRSCLIAGAAAVTATGLAFTAVQPTPHDVAVPAHSTSAAPHLTQAMVDLLAAANRMTATLPTPPTVPHPQASGFTPSSTPGNDPIAVQPSALLGGFPGVQDAIIGTYNTVEPWVQYGFQLAEYAAGWVPIVGWLAPQIGIVYDFGEAIVGSVVYNVAYWIGGTQSFGAGVGNVIRDSIQAGIDLVQDEVGWILPPLPPLPVTTVRTASATTPVALESLTTTLATARQNLLAATKDLPGLTKPISSILHAFDPATTLDSLRRDLDTRLDSWHADKAETRRDAESKSDDVASVPRSVRRALQGPDDARPHLVRGPRLSSRTEKPTVRSQIRDAVDAAKDASDKKRHAIRTAIKNATPERTDNRTMRDGTAEKATPSRPDKRTSPKSTSKSTSKSKSNKGHSHRSRTNK